MTSERVSQSLSRALTDLMDERARIDVAIQQLQGLLGQVATASPRRAAHPVSTATEGKKTVRRWTAAGRKAAAERMRRYWAARRKPEGKKAGKSAKANGTAKATKANGTAKATKANGSAKATKANGSAKADRSKSWSPSARKAAAERMRRYWADHRKSAQADA